MESNEILAVVDSVSTEKGLEKDVIFKAIEVAIASASQRHFHEDADLYVSINRDTGEYTTHRNWIVFDESEMRNIIMRHMYLQRNQNYQSEKFTLNNKIILSLEGLRLKLLDKLCFKK